jgi:hypothetical protein
VPSVQHRDDLAGRVDHDPEPERMCLATEPRPQVVELEVRELEISEAAFV